MFGPSHWAAIAATVVAGVVMIWLRRSGHNRLARAGEWLLAAALMMRWPVDVYFHTRMGDLTLDEALPLHYCDVASFTGAYALITHRQWASELVYFFGLAGTLQGLITPALQIDFPSLRYFVFFVWHGGVVVVALYVVTALGRIPRAWSIGRMLASSLAYAAIIGAINAALGTNYGFLCRKPDTASMMDYFGPWPWYIGTLIGVSGLAYLLLDIPFWRMRRRMPASAHGTANR